MLSETAFRNNLAMTCPVCHVALQMTSRQGVEIDFCPQCRGIWLDRGELDKILDKEASYRPENDRDRDVRGYAPRYDRDDDDDDYRRDGYGKRRKRGGLLGELFDFD